MKFSTFLKCIVGFLALALGAVGLFLPLLPTTPFVLLAVGCFSATPRLRLWLLRIRFVREYYDSYTKGTGLRPRTLLCSLLFLWTMLLFSCVLLLEKTALVLMLVLIGLAVSIHLMYLARVRTKCRKEVS